MGIGEKEKVCMDKKDIQFRLGLIKVLVEETMKGLSEGHLIVNRRGRGPGKAKKSPTSITYKRGPGRPPKNQVVSQ
jgi:hypothetical protein